MALRPIAVALALVATPLSAAPHPNWNNTVAVTPLGSHVLGNPAAASKLVEYISYTCPHCAAFEARAAAPLRLGYVQPGAVSLEVRNLVRDPVDLAVAMLTNCGPGARFFANHDAFLLHQGEWMATAQQTTEAQRQRWNDGPLPARLRAIAGDLGFYAIMERRGYSRVEADRCLADPAILQHLRAQIAEAEKIGANVTPSFVLDGALLTGTYTWDALEPQLKART